MTDAMPLTSREAEQAVLGAMILDGAAAMRAAELLRPADFAFDAHQRLFDALADLARRAVTIDAVTLRDALATRDELDRVGGLPYLAELLDATPAAANVEFHARIVREKAVRRQVVADAKVAMALAQDQTVPIGEAVARMVDRLVKVAHPESAATQRSLRDDLWGVLDDLARQAKGGDAVVGVPSGLPRLDELTDGWVPGRLTVVAARPKMGKTSFGLHCAREAARGEVRTYFATAEQPQRELVRRLVAMETRLNLRAITSEAMLDMNSRTLNAATNEIASWPLHIDAVSRTPAAVRLGVQRQQAEHGSVGLVVVDYLGKYHSGQKAERHDLEVGAMTGAFAQMAMDLNVPVLLLVQLNRASVRDGKPRRPTPSDLRDSGSIEQDAAQVLFLYHDEGHEDAHLEPNLLQIILELNRFGPTGDVLATFDRDAGRFRPYIRERADRRVA